RAVAEALGYPPARLFLCGLSMGGYGALRIGAKHGARFAGISAHSAITRLEELEDFVEESPRLAGGRMQDRCALRTILAHRATLPALRFDCGVEDPLIAGNRML
ncbi:alpha/beta hydrolase-fold protein, partial [Escherichia coli]|uniref:alpha/beta hydrolase-fold protein n=7 Tax=Pseudomonadota TaxID=1224 RepID=UPI00185E196C